jgi:hypothetical protein
VSCCLHKGLCFCHLLLPCTRLRVSVVGLWHLPGGLGCSAAALASAQCECTCSALTGSFEGERLAHLCPCQPAVVFGELRRSLVGSCKLTGWGADVSSAAFPVASNQSLAVQYQDQCNILFLQVLLVWMQYKSRQKNTRFSDMLLPFGALVDRRKRIEQTQGVTIESLYRESL